MCLCVYVLVAAIQGQTIGYASLCPLIQPQFGLRGIDMNNLFVEQDFRGLGIGRQLIAASMQKARALSCSDMAVGTYPTIATLRPSVRHADLIGFTARIQGSASHLNHRLSFQTECHDEPARIYPPAPVPSLSDRC